MKNVDIDMTLYVEEIIIHNFVRSDVSVLVAPGHTKFPSLLIAHWWVYRSFVCMILNDILIYTWFC